MQQMIHFPEVTYIGEHLVDFQSQGGQKGQNGDQRDDTLNDVQGPAEQMFGGSVPAGDLVNVGLNLRVIGMGDVVMAHRFLLLN